MATIKRDDMRTTQEWLEAGVTMVQVETPDLDGRLRGKLTRLEKILDSSGSAFCTILYGLTPNDEICEGPLSSFDNGFPDALAIPDAQTLRLIDKEQRVAAVICDMVDADSGKDYALSPRGALRRQIQRADALGLQPRFAAELEFCILQVDDARIINGEHHRLDEYGRIHNAYSLARAAEARELSRTFIEAMDAIGIPIEAMHAELGRGMMELAISHLPAMEAADACARVKLYLKDYCAQRGLCVSFMPKWKYHESGCGGHIHQSLWRDGEPAFCAPDGGLSTLAKSYIAGQLKALAENAAIFYPTINAYRRMDAGAWAPENVSWGLDNRTCALRAILQPGPKAYRFEHRCPGADINPYLAMAIMLGTGLDGVENALEPPAPVKGNAANDASLQPLPCSLGAAIDLLAGSESARRILGDAMLEQYLVLKRHEWDRWNAWQREQVTSWELARYFDTH